MPSMAPISGAPISGRLVVYVPAGGVVTSNLLLLGIGCVGWISLVLPTWYLTEGM